MQSLHTISTSCQTLGTVTLVPFCFGRKRTLALLQENDKLPPFFLSPSKGTGRADVTVTAASYQQHGLDADNQKYAQD